MASQRDGGFAFPRSVSDAMTDIGSVYSRGHPGMSFWDWCFGLAMQGLLSNPERYRYIAGKVESGELSQEEATAKNVHKAARIADAMVETRETIRHERNQK